MVVADMKFFVVAFFSSLKSDAKSSMESEEEKRRVRGMRREEMIRNNLKESRKMNGLGEESEMSGQTEGPHLRFESSV